MVCLGDARTAVVSAAWMSAPSCSVSQRRSNTVSTTWTPKAGPRGPAFPDQTGRSMVVRDDQPLAPVAQANWRRHAVAWCRFGLAPRVCQCGDHEMRRSTDLVPPIMKLYSQPRRWILGTVGDRCSLNLRQIVSVYKTEPGVYRW